MRSGAADLRAAALSGGLWLLLGGWVGAWFLFAFAVAPAAFQVLPAADAGGVVGPVIGALHVYGAIAGIALAWIARALGRGRWHQGLPLLMAGLCLVTEFVLTPQIDGLRDLAFGPEANLEATARWWRLHGISMALYTTVGVLALVLSGLHAWSDAAGAEAPRAGGVGPNPAKNRADSAKNA
jgi:disulfide bond formation protein DsbB